MFDSADFNVATLTGHDTFHAMGGIACVTPPGTVDKLPIKRTVKASSAELLGTFKQIPIKTYSKPAASGLQSVTVEPLKVYNSQRFLATSIDCVWMLGYVLNLTPRFLWSGFMKTVFMKNYGYQTSRIETLPFINLDPSKLSTIYTALCFAQDLCEKNYLKTCPVTFDQPLFQKASEIVASSKDLNRVIVRLGGFHLLMSYLDSVGQIMSGSRIAELWEQVYAKGSVVHMLNGHAFSRAVRAHILTLLALMCVLMEMSNWLNQTDKEHLESVYKGTIEQVEGAAFIQEHETVRQFHQLVSQHLDQATSQSKTGKLWVQYAHQVILMLNFFRAERTGDWKLHLNCVREMIPHFHAARHLPYANFCQTLPSADGIHP